MRGWQLQACLGASGAGRRYLARAASGSQLEVTYLPSTAEPALDRFLTLVERPPDVTDPRLHLPERLLDLRFEGAFFGAAPRSPAVRLRSVLPCPEIPAAFQVGVEVAGALARVNRSAAWTGRALVHGHLGADVVLLTAAGEVSVDGFDHAAANGEELDPREDVAGVGWLMLELLLGRQPVHWLHLRWNAAVGDQRAQLVSGALRHRVDPEAARLIARLIGPARDRPGWSDLARRLAKWAPDGPEHLRAWARTLPMPRPTSDPLDGEWIGKDVPSTAAPNPAACPLPLVPTPRPSAFAVGGPAPSGVRTVNRLVLGLGLLVLGVGWGSLLVASVVIRGGF